MMMKSTEKRPGKSVEPPIYLDYNATTPVDPEVIQAMEPFFREHFGNPSSSHYYGSITRTAIEKARLQLARFISAKPQEIIFTSGGTESNNLAIQGIAYENQHKGRHIITSTVEHPAVSEVCKYLEKNGFRITYVPVDHYGMIDPSDVEEAIRKDTILISIMHANNEVGTIQPLKEIADIAKAHGIVFHSDGAQSLGKIHVDVNELNVDMFSIAGHKVYAPKGIGALYIRDGIKIEKVYHGADHEQNQRPGTENVLQIVGLGKACEVAGENFDSSIESMKKSRDLLEKTLLNEFPEMKINGHPDIRLPNTLNVSFRNLEASSLLLAMHRVAASAGAACHTNEITISPVLEAMHLPVDLAMGTIRFSTGRWSTEKEILKASEEIIKRVKEFLPASTDKVIHINDDDEVKLTQYTHGLGCACKLRPQDLETVLKDMPVVFDSNILVGPETADDAAVYKINDELALVQTVDFFTPVVDDPYQFGAIAATNALSDIYAMGANPSFALNIVGFPAKRLPLSVLTKILQGAADKAKEAGIPILGGHTVEDNEPKFGMVVSGFVHPEKMWKNEGALPGDVLVLSKPLGLGIMSTALKRGLLDKNKKEEIADLMMELNKSVADFISDYDIHSCTDVTGFGLLGHLMETLKASGVSAELWMDHIPLIDGVESAAAGGVIPGGTKNNLSFVEDDVEFMKELGSLSKYLLADAQTSGGLLFSIPAQQLKDLIERSKSSGLDLHPIGTITKKGEKYLSVFAAKKN